MTNPNDTMIQARTGAALVLISTSALLAALEVTGEHRLTSGLESVFSQLIELAKDARENAQGLVDLLSNDSLTADNDK